jgi:hypothetical protein
VNTSRAATKRKPKAAKAGAIVVAYKGFNEDWTCRGYQYAAGETYVHPGAVVACPNLAQVASGCGGFHACEYPLDVFGYYAPARSRYAIVEQSGTLARHGEDSKIASSKITIKGEIGIPGLVKAAVEYIVSRCDPPGKDSAATNTGNRSAATNTGNWSAATNTGNWSAATNTGDRSAATNTGNWSAATNTGNWSAATNTGNQSAATNTGNWSAASVEGQSSIAIASGKGGRSMGAKGCALFLVERDDNYKIVAVWAGIVGHGGIKPNVWYTLKDGKPVEVAS